MGMMARNWSAVTGVGCSAALPTGMGAARGGHAAGQQVGRELLAWINAQSGLACPSSRAQGHCGSKIAQRFEVGAQADCAGAVISRAVAAIPRLHGVGQCVLEAVGAGCNVIAGLRVQCRVVKGGLAVAGSEFEGRAVGHTLSLRN